MSQNESFDTKWTATAKLFNWGWKILVLGFCACLFVIALAILVHVIRNVISNPGPFYLDTETALAAMYVYCCWYVLGTMNILIEKATGIDIAKGLKSIVKGND